jgi:putative acyl-CoA dehydrogenase
MSCVSMCSVRSRNFQPVELRAATGTDPRYDAFLNELERDIVDILRTESTARRIVEQIALALSASLLRHAPHDIADAFIASRLAGPWSGHFGTLSRGANAQAIARRVAPQLM